MTTNVGDWHSFFSAAQIITDSVSKADKLLQLHLGSSFNVFDFIQPDENRLSDLLRDLLDPSGRHGQGEIFLKLAIQNLLPAFSIDCTALKHCKVIREAVTRDGRLIDLVLDFGVCGIGIENKPFAAEQPDQLADYADHLQRQFDGRFCLMFLHAPGFRSNSLGESRRDLLQAAGQFSEVPYNARGTASLHAWLENCAAASQSEKIRLFLLDFATYVQMRFKITDGDPS